MLYPRPLKDTDKVSGEDVMSNGILGTASAAIAVISAGLGVYATWQSVVLKQRADDQALSIADQGIRIQQADQQLRLRADSRAETASEREYVIKVFDKVTAALEGSDSKKQQIALALVETLSDAALRERISRTFQIAPEVTAEIRASASQLQQRAAEAVTQQQAFAQQGLVKWAYDIFWCETGSNNKAIASRIFNNLATQPNKRLQLRAFSKESNAVSGYQVTGFQIRAEQVELPQAKILKEYLEASTGLSLAITLVNNRTPDYISIFICDP